MGTPVWAHDGIVCVANALKDKVKLIIYQGAHFTDPDKHFNNGLEGKQWRTIDIYKGYKINKDSLKTLVNAAVAYNQSKVKTANKPGAMRSYAQKKQRSNAVQHLDLYAWKGKHPDVFYNFFNNYRRLLYSY